jgi:hypothetical protein
MLSLIGHSCATCSFKRGGRGWVNPLAAKRDNGGVKDDLKPEGQMRKEAKKRERTKQHLHAKAAIKKKQGKGKGGGQGAAKGKGRGKR